MRVLVTTQPAYGHFHPLVPLARALVAAGHEVRVATAASFQREVGAAGLAGVVAGLDWTAANMTRDFPESASAGIEWTLRELFARRTAPALAADVEKLARSWRPDLVVRETWEIGGALAAATLGVPCAVFGVGRRRNAEQLVELAAPALAELRPDGDAAFAWMDGDLYLDSCPAFLDLPRVRPAPARTVAIRPEPFDGTVAAPELGWLGEPRTRPLVLVGLGTVMHRKPGLLQGLVASVRELDVDALVTSGPGRHFSLVAPDPPRLRVERYVPLGLVLPHCAAVLCHAGWGTLVATLSHGLPLVCVPLGADGPQNAARAEDFGASLTVGVEDAVAGRATGAVATILAEPAFRERAEEARAELAAMPSPTEAVAALEALA
jgi:UDP:flavonoid glycosyltransferase YjiC (YdhE family)